ncbi:hypothetical protein OCA23_27470 [Bacillus cereus]|nr:hypothetical protein [Bacillus cereus]
MIDDLTKKAQDAGYTKETVDNHKTKQANEFFVIKLGDQLILKKFRKIQENLLSKMYSKRTSLLF